MQNMVAALHAWVETRSTGIEPLHEVRDEIKHQALVSDMHQRGWVGAPVVVDGPWALTGSHRLAAANEVGVDVPRVEIAHVCRVAGLDWDAMRDEHPSWDMYDVTLHAIDLLPEEIVDYLGLDLH